MLVSLKKFFLFKLHKSLKNNEIREQFLQEIYFNNYQRFYILGFFILLYFSLILSINTISLWLNKEIFFQQLDYFFYFHIAFFIYFIFLIPVMYLNRPLQKKDITQWHHYAFIISISIFMILVISMTAYAQKKHTHINAFILASYASALFFTWRNRESIAFFGMSLVLMIIGIFIFQSNQETVQSHFLNLVLLTLVSWIVSRIFYFSSLKKFIHEKTIRNQKNRLEYLNDLLVKANSQLHETNEQARLELNLAANVQRDFLFRNSVSINGWEIGFLFQPASAVSGDFYDVFTGEADNTILPGVALFDVSGHGIGSGLITLLAKSIIFQNYRTGSWLPLGRVMKNINTELVREIGHLDNFITGILLRIHKDYMEYVNAGHPDIIIRRYETKKIITGKRKDDAADTCLGLEAGLGQYNTYQIPFFANDLFFIFSDGFFEVIDNTKKISGYDWLCQILSTLPENLSAKASLDWIWDQYRTFTQNQILKDDVTALILRRITAA